MSDKSLDPKIYLTSSIYETETDMARDDILKLDVTWYPIGVLEAPRYRCEIKSVAKITDDERNETFMEEFNRIMHTDFRDTRELQNMLYNLHEKVKAYKKIPIKGSDDGN